MKKIIIFTLLALSALTIFGCTKSDDDNPAAPVTNYLTLQSRPDTSYGDWFYIAGQTTDSDSAIYAEFTSSQAGKLDKIKIMFGHWDSGTSTLVPVDVKIFSKSGTSVGTQRGTTVNIPINSIIDNTTNQYRWTEVSFAGQNLSVANGEHFYVSVTPRFTYPLAANSLEKMYLSIDSRVLNSNGVIFNVLQDDGTFRAFVPADSEGDCGIAAVISY